MDISPLPAGAHSKEIFAKRQTFGQQQRCCRAATADQSARTHSELVCYLDINAQYNYTIRYLQSLARTKQVLA